MIPKKITTYLRDELNITIQYTKTLSGGSINQAVKITSNQGDFFLKWNHSAPDDFFEKEALGLKLLKEADSKLYIPSVIAMSRPDPDFPGFLLIEFVDEGEGGDSLRFGAELAKLHQNRSEQFGLYSDNYIGSLPQFNRWHDKWDSFFVEERINPQLKMAIDSEIFDQSIMRHWDRLASQLNDRLPKCKPSLIHGDLWGGNYLFNQSGEAVLIDPAVYYGHPEMDLAFTKMFGGFSREFYEGYASVSPLEPGFSDRISVYNLYPLLVHVNLFGGHYSKQCRSYLEQF